MSVAAKDDVDNGERDITSMYAPPWARDAATDAADAAVGAATNLRRVLPIAPHLLDPEARLRPQELAPFEGEAAIQEPRAWPTLDPIAVPGPPSQGSRRSIFPFVAWISAAAGAASLVAMIAGVEAPEWLRGLQEGTKAFGTRMFATSTNLTAPKLAEHGAVRVTNPPIQMPELAAAGTRIVAPPAVAPSVVAAPVVARPPPQSAALAALPAPSAIAPPVPSLDREEIAALYERGEQLIAQGEIAAARLVFTRAAEAGDARSALALGASYDPDVLRKLGVLGVRGDAALAREWYAKASGFGSREAAKRMELMATGP
jgi:hypothetical protein